MCANTLVLLCKKLRMRSGCGCKGLLWLSLIFLLVLLGSSWRPVYNFRCGSSSSSSSQPVPKQSRSKSIDPALFHFRIYNQMGVPGSTLNMLDTILAAEPDPTLRRKIENVTQNARNFWINVKPEYSVKRTNRTHIIVAMVVCGGGRTELEAKVSLKTAAMFSQDANLHFIVYGDGNVTTLAPWLLELKWTANHRGFDFTFEFRLAALPPMFTEADATEWIQTEKQCASLRLFFPLLLPDLDAILYMDSDSVVISNLTQLWAEFDKMSPYQMLAMGHYMIGSAVGEYEMTHRVPHAGPKGVNSGLILMNLTRMRAFDLTKRAMAISVAYKGKIAWHDQDILNALLYPYSDLLYLLPCPYTFYTQYCGWHKGVHQKRCVFESVEGPLCFCNETLRDGVYLVNGSGDNFFWNPPSLFNTLFNIMLKMSLATDSYMDIHRKLVTTYDALHNPCFSLTGGTMYKNFYNYFEKLGIP